MNWAVHWGKHEFFLCWKVRRKLTLGEETMLKVSFLLVLQKPFITSGESGKVEMIQLSLLTILPGSNQLWKTHIPLMSLQQVYCKSNIFILHIYSSFMSCRANLKPQVSLYNLTSDLSYLILNSQSPLEIAIIPYPQHLFQHFGNVLL